VVGLGNPGSEFEHTRHNVGADTVELLAGRNGASLRPERGTSARLAGVHPGGRSLVLAVPTTYMNESGVAVRALVRRCSVSEPGQLLIVHDELDLPPGTIRLKLGGGTAGHNGLRSIEAHLHRLDFARLRIGIGKPPGRTPGADYVLRRPPRAEGELLAVALERAADAIELVLSRGVEAAMNEVNVR
jgi:PTH1 family peptidyl-tRNA hydrolase